MKGKRIAVDRWVNVGSKEWSRSSNGIKGAIEGVNGVILMICGCTRFAYQSAE